jgi:hypothetical protein
MDNLPLVGFRKNKNPPPFDPPLANLELDVEDPVTVPDAQSAPMMLGFVMAPQKIPLTQNHPSKCCSNTFYFLFVLDFIPLSQYHP